jgi:hypothetical protein
MQARKEVRESKECKHEYCRLENERLQPGKVKRLKDSNLQRWERERMGAGKGENVNAIKKEQRAGQDKKNTDRRREGGKIYKLKEVLAGVCGDGMRNRTSIRETEKRK